MSVHNMLCIIITHSYNCNYMSPYATLSVNFLEICKSTQHCAPAKLYQLQTVYLSATSCSRSIDKLTVLCMCMRGEIVRLL